jgi:hypothetical protein
MECCSSLGRQGSYEVFIYVFSISILKFHREPSDNIISKMLYPMWCIKYIQNAFYSISCLTVSNKHIKSNRRFWELYRYLIFKRHTVTQTCQEH